MRLSPFFPSLPGFGFESLQSEFSRLFDRAGGTFSGFPAFEIASDENGLRMRALVPGVAPENLDIEIEDRVLTLSGRTVLGGETGAEGKATGAGGTTFVRRLKLPYDVDTDAAEARLEHGLLDLFLPRPAKDAPRRIQITGGTTEEKAQLTE